MIARQNRGNPCLRKGDNVYLRKDGRWEARYIKEHTPSGLVKYGYCYGSSREEAMAKANAVKGAEGRTIAQYLEEWLEDLSARATMGSLDSYRTIAKKYILPRFGNSLPNELDKAALEEFKQDLLEKKGLSRSRVHTVLSMTQSVVRYARQDDLPFNVTCYRGPRKAARVLSTEEQRKLTTCLRLGMDECKFGILLALSTGLRVGELCALRWKDISINDQTLQVTATMQRVKHPDGHTQVVIASPANTASMRVIPLTVRAVEMCKKMCPGDEDAFVLTGTRKYMEPRVAELKIKKYAEFCGLEGVGFTTLRNTFANRCVETGIDPESLREILGYSKIQSIPDILFSSSSERKHAGMRRLGAAGL